MKNMCLLGFVSVFFASCVSFTTAQTARVVKPGKGTAFGGVSFANLTENKKEKNTSSEDDVFSLQPDYPFESIGIEGGARYGVAHNMDVGVLASNLGLATVDTKYQFVNGHSFASAFGLGASFMQYRASGQKTGKAMAASVPWFNSYDLTDSLSLCLTPRYMIIQHTPSEGSNPNSSLAGASFSFIAGQDIALVMEASFYKTLGERPQTIGRQFVVGLLFGKNNTK